MSKNKGCDSSTGKSQFGLMTIKRFAPFFWTQFFGAFNDNVFRNGLMIMIAYGTGSLLAGKSDIMINVAAGLFILPFFIFSATAGQIADKYEKSMLIQRIKIFEIGIMALAAIAFYGLYGIISGLTDDTQFFDTQWLETIVDFIIKAGAVIISFVFFPTAMLAIVSLFEEKIAKIIEAGMPINKLQRSPQSSAL